MNNLYSLLWVLLFPILLLSQEQVSDISTSGTFGTTVTSDLVGFALIDDNNYMLVENDSLTIYRWDSSNFEIEHVFNDLGTSPISTSSSSSPNRSLFEVRGRKYYRLTYDRLLIIDIPTGTIDYQTTAEEHGFSSFGAEHYLLEDRLYFRAWVDRAQVRFYLDFESNKITERTTSGYILGENEIIKRDSTTVKIINIYNGNSSVIQFTEKIYTNSYIAADSTMRVITDQGTIWKIDKSMKLAKYDCKVDLSSINQILFNGERMIHIYNGDTPRTREVNVTNLSNCILENKHIISIDYDGPIGIRLVRNEDYDTSFSFISFFGYTNGDEIQPSQNYLIDHLHDDYLQIPDGSGIYDFTPFRYDDDIYFTKYHSSFWVFRHETMMKYDPLQKELTPIEFGEDQHTLYASFGYSHDNKLFCVTNTFHEDVRLWQIDENTEVNEIGKLNFLDELGINYLNDVIATEDSIYFVTNDRLYSLLDEERKIKTLPHGPLYKGWKNYRLDKYDNYIFFVHIDNPEIIVYDRATGNSREIRDSNTTMISQYYDVAGPYVFYNNQDTVKIVDVRSGEILYDTELPHVSQAASGPTSAYFGYRSGYTNVDSRLMKIEYTTQEISEINIDIENDLDIIRGNNNLVYIVDEKKNSDIDSMRIRSLSEDGQINLIYNGPGYYISEHSELDDSTEGITYFVLSAKGKKTLVIHDGSNTGIYELPFTSSNSTRDPIIATSKDDVLYYTNDNTDRQVMLINANRSQNIMQPDSNINIRYADINDEVITMIYYDANDILKSLIYHTDNNTSRTSVIRSEGVSSNLREGIRMTNSKLILNRAVVNDDERKLYILDTASDSLYIQPDVSKGDFYINPYNFVMHKDWIYFLATTEGYDQQWFRYKESGSSSILELPISAKHELLVSPNPAYDQISLDQRLTNIEIYTSSGQLISKTKKLDRANSLDISYLESGLYVIIGLSPDNRVFSSKFIKIGQ